MSIKDAFASFASALELEPDELNYAAECHAKGRKALEALPGWEGDFLSGSYGRHTRLTPLNDVDVVIRCASAEPWAGDSEAALQACRELLKPVFPGALTRLGAHAMKVYPKDAPTKGLHLDVVVGVPGGAGTVLLITEPGSEAGWLKSDPQAHAKLLSDTNNAWEGRLKPAIKMLKSWNRKHNEPVASFLIEALLLRVFEPEGDLEYPQMIATFFERAAGAILTPTSNPAVPDGYVDGELSRDDREEVAALFQTAADEAQAALDAAREDEEKAQNLWRDFFGKPFPAPGEDTKKSTIEKLANAIDRGSARVGIGGVIVTGSVGRQTLPVRSFGDAENTEE